MATDFLQVRVDEKLHAQAASIFEDLGMDIQTAVRIFLKKTVRENGLPFDLTLNDRRSSVIENGIRAITHMQESAEKAGLSDMSLDEINAEIAAARAERHAKGVEGAASGL